MSLLLLFGSAGAPAVIAPTAYEQPVVARRRSGWRTQQVAPDPATLRSHVQYSTKPVAEAFTTRTVRSRQRVDLPLHLVFPPTDRVTREADDTAKIRRYRGRRLKQLLPLEEYPATPTTPTPDVYPARELEKAARRHGWRKRLSAIDPPRFDAHVLYSTRAVDEAFATRTVRSRRHLRVPELVSASAAAPPTSEADISATTLPGVKRRHTRRLGVEEILFIASLPVQPLPAWQRVQTLRHSFDRRLQALPQHDEWTETPPPAGQPQAAWAGVAANRRTGWRTPQAAPDPVVAAVSLPPTAYNRPGENPFAIRTYRGRRVRVAPTLIVADVAAPPAVPEAAWLPVPQRLLRRDTTARPDIEVTEFIASLPAQPEPAWRRVKALRHSFERRLQALPAHDEWAQAAPPPAQPEGAWRAASANRRHGDRWLRSIPQHDSYPQIPPTPAQHPVSWLPREAFRRNGWRAFKHAPDWLPADVAVVVPDETPGGPTIMRPMSVREKDLDKALEDMIQRQLARQIAREDEELIIIAARLL